MDQKRNPRDNRAQPKNEGSSPGSQKGQPRGPRWLPKDKKKRNPVAKKVTGGPGNAAGTAEERVVKEHSGPSRPLEEPEVPSEIEVGPKGNQASMDEAAQDRGVNDEGISKKSEGGSQEVRTSEDQEPSEPKANPEQNQDSETLPEEVEETFEDDVSDALKPQVLKDASEEVSAGTIRRRQRSFKTPTPPPEPEVKEVLDETPSEQKAEEKEEVDEERPPSPEVQRVSKAARRKKTKQRKQERRAEAAVREKANAGVHAEYQATKLPVKSLLDTTVYSEKFQEISPGPDCAAADRAEGPKGVDETPGGPEERSRSARVSENPDDAARVADENQIPEKPKDRAEDISRASEELEKTAEEHQIKISKKSTEMAKDPKKTESQLNMPTGNKDEEGTTKNSEKEIQTQAPTVLLDSEPQQAKVGEYAAETLDQSGTGSAQITADGTKQEESPVISVPEEQKEANEGNEMNPQELFEFIIQECKAFGRTDLVDERKGSAPTFWKDMDHFLTCRESTLPETQVSQETNSGQAERAPEIQETSPITSSESESQEAKIRQDSQEKVDHSCTQQVQTASVEVQQEVEEKERVDTSSSVSIREEKKEEESTKSPKRERQEKEVQKKTEITPSAIPGGSTITQVSEVSKSPEEANNAPEKEEQEEKKVDDQGVQPTPKGTCENQESAHITEEAETTQEINLEISLQELEELKSQCPLSASTSVAKTAEKDETRPETHEQPPKAEVPEDTVEQETGESISDTPGELNMSSESPKISSKSLPATPRKKIAQEEERPRSQGCSISPAKSPVRSPTFRVPLAFWGSREELGGQKNPEVQDSDTAEGPSEEVRRSTEEQGVSQGVEESNSPSGPPPEIPPRAQEPRQIVPNRGSRAAPLEAVVSRRYLGSPAEKFKVFGFYWDENELEERGCPVETIIMNTEGEQGTWGLIPSTKFAPNPRDFKETYESWDIATDLAGASSDTNATMIEPKVEEQETQEEPPQGTPSVNDDTRHSKELQEEIPKQPKQTSDKDEPEEYVSKKEQLSPESVPEAQPKPQEAAECDGISVAARKKSDDPEVAQDVAGEIEQEEKEPEVQEPAKTSSPESQTREKVLEPSEEVLDQEEQRQPLTATAEIPVEQEVEKEEEQAPAAESSPQEPPSGEQAKSSQMPSEEAPKRTSDEAEPAESEEGFEGEEFSQLSSLPSIPEILSDIEEVDESGRTSEESTLPSDDREATPAISRETEQEHKATLEGQDPSEEKPLPQAIPEVQPETAEAEESDGISKEAKKEPEDQEDIAKPSSPETQTIGKARETSEEVLGQEEQKKPLTSEQDVENEGEQAPAAEFSPQEQPSGDQASSSQMPSEETPRRTSDKAEPEVSEEGFESEQFSQQSSLPSTPEILSDIQKVDESGRTSEGSTLPSDDREETPATSEETEQAHKETSGPRPALKGEDPSEGKPLQVSIPEVQPETLEAQESDLIPKEAKKEPEDQEDIAKPSSPETQTIEETNELSEGAHKQEVQKQEALEPPGEGCPETQSIPEIKNEEKQDTPEQSPHGIRTIEEEATPSEGSHKQNENEKAETEAQEKLSGSSQQTSPKTQATSGNADEEKQDVPIPSTPKTQTTEKVEEPSEEPDKQETNEAEAHKISPKPSPTKLWTTPPSSGPQTIYRGAEPSEEIEKQGKQEQDRPRTRESSRESSPKRWSENQTTSGYVSEEEQRLSQKSGRSSRGESDSEGKGEIAEVQVVPEEPKKIPQDQAHLEEEKSPEVSVFQVNFSEAESVLEPKPTKGIEVRDKNLAELINILEEPGTGSGHVSTPSEEIDMMDDLASMVNIIKSERAENLASRTGGKVAGVPQKEASLVPSELYITAGTSGQVSLEEERKTEAKETADEAKPTAETEVSDLAEAEFVDISLGEGYEPAPNSPEENRTIPVLLRDNPENDAAILLKNWSPSASGVGTGSPLQSSLPKKPQPGSSGAKGGILQYLQAQEEAGLSSESSFIDELQTSSSAVSTTDESSDEEPQLPPGINTKSNRLMVMQALGVRDLQAKFLQSESEGSFLEDASDEEQEAESPGSKSERSSLPYIETIQKIYFHTKPEEVKPEVPKQRALSDDGRGKSLADETVMEEQRAGFDKNEATCSLQISCSNLVDSVSTSCSLPEMETLAAVVEEKGNYICIAREKEVSLAPCPVEGVAQRPQKAIGAEETRASSGTAGISRGPSLASKKSISPEPNLPDGGGEKEQLSSGSDSDTEQKEEETDQHRRQKEGGPEGGEGQGKGGGDGGDEDDRKDDKKDGEGDGDRDEGEEEGGEDDDEEETEEEEEEKEEEEEEEEDKEGKDDNEDNEDDNEDEEGGDGQMEDMEEDDGSEESEMGSHLDEPFEALGRKVFDYDLKFGRKINRCEEESSSEDEESSDGQMEDQHEDSGSEEPQMRPRRRSPDTEEEERNFLQILLSSYSDSSERISPVEKQPGDEVDEGADGKMEDKEEDNGSDKQQMSPRRKSPATDGETKTMKREDEEKDAEKFEEAQNDQDEVEDEGGEDVEEEEEEEEEEKEGDEEDDNNDKGDDKRDDNEDEEGGGGQMEDKEEHNGSEEQQKSPRGKSPDTDEEMEKLNHPLLEDESESNDRGSPIEEELGHHKEGEALNIPIISEEEKCPESMRIPGEIFPRVPRHFSDEPTTSTSRTNLQQCDKSPRSSDSSLTSVTPLSSESEENNIEDHSDRRDPYREAEKQPRGHHKKETTSSMTRISEGDRSTEDMGSQGEIFPGAPSGFLDELAPSLKSPASIDPSLILVTPRSSESGKHNTEDTSVRREPHREEKGQATEMTTLDEGEESLNKSSSLQSDIETGGKEQPQRQEGPPARNSSAEDEETENSPSPNKYPRDEAPFEPSEGQSLSRRTAMESHEKVLLMLKTCVDFTKRHSARRFGSHPGLLINSLDPVLASVASDNGFSGPGILPPRSFGSDYSHAQGIQIITESPFFSNSEALIKPTSLSEPEMGYDIDLLHGKDDLNLLNDMLYDTRIEQSSPTSEERFVLYNPGPLSGPNRYSEAPEIENYAEGHEHKHETEPLPVEIRTPEELRDLMLYASLSAEPLNPIHARTAEQDTNADDNGQISTETENTNRQEVVDPSATGGSHEQVQDEEPEQSLTCALLHTAKQTLSKCNDEKLGEVGKAKESQNENHEEEEEDETNNKENIKSENMEKAEPKYQLKKNQCMEITQNQEQFYEERINQERINEYREQNAESREEEPKKDEDARPNLEAANPRRFPLLIYVSVLVTIGFIVKHYIRSS